LIRNGEQIVIRDTLIERLYGIETDVSGNAIEATVSRLRRKLHALGSNVHIEVVRGIGYRLRQRASGA
jgi:two-component system response regulator QseB